MDDKLFGMHPLQPSGLIDQEGIPNLPGLPEHEILDHEIVHNPDCSENGIILNPVSTVGLESGIDDLIVTEQEHHAVQGQENYDHIVASESSIMTTGNSTEKNLGPFSEDILVKDAILPLQELWVGNGVYIEEDEKLRRQNEEENERQKQDILKNFDEKAHERMDNE
jgi:hypothetical protein